MSYNFRTRLPHVGNRMSAINSEDVVYSNGSYSVIWSATPTQPVQMEDGYGNVVRTTTFRKDFIGHTATLVLNGSSYLPQAGDSLTRGNGEVYKVVSEGDELPPWEYVTDVRDRIRVRTVLVTGEG